MFSMSWSVNCVYEGRPNEKIITCLCDYILTQILLLNCNENKTDSEFENIMEYMEGFEGKKKIGKWFLKLQNILDLYG